MLHAEIVILNWNGAAHLRRFLPSVLEAADGAGVVVADNGSTDESLELLAAAFPQVRVVRLDRNYGFAEGYNRALEQVEADVFVLLNSDVETPEGWLAPLLECLERNPDVAAVAPKLRSVDEPDRFEYAGAAGGYIDFWGYPFCRGRILRSVERDTGQYDDEREVFWVSGAAFCCRAEAFRAAGGFDADFFAHMEEIDFCWRAQLAGYAIRVEPRSRVFHVGGGTLPNDNPHKIYLNFRNNLCMLYKNLSRPAFWPVLFVRMAMDGLAALVFLLQGRPSFFGKVFRAHVDFHRQRRSLRAKRKAVQNSRVARSRWIYRGSIVLRHALGRRIFGRMM